MDERSTLDPRLKDLFSTVIDLARSERVPAGEGASGLDAALAAARDVAEELRAFRADAKETEQRLDELVRVIGSLVGLNYDRRATVTDRGDAIDGFAMGLNMMAEELEATTVSKEYVNDILQSMRDPLMVTSPEGSLTTVNRAAGEMLGEKADAFVGDTIERLFPNFSAQALIQSGGVSGIETWCVRRDGNTVPVLFTASVMHSRKGEVSGLVCVARDLTELKRMEEERWNLRETMHRTVVLLEELSTPLIPVSRDIVVTPLIGTLDARRAEQLMGVLLNGIVERQACVAIIDVTGVRTLNQQAMEGIVNAIKGVRLLGAQALLTGIRPEVARVLGRLDLGSHHIDAFGSLQDGIAYALRSISTRKHGSGINARNTQ